MSNTINVNYMTRAYNQYQQKNAAKDQEKEDTRFADSVREKSEASGSIVGNSKIGSVSAKDMTMVEYKQYIYNKISQIPMHPTRAGESISVTISEAGFEAMKNDPESSNDAYINGLLLLFCKNLEMKVTQLSVEEKQTLKGIFSRSKPAKEHRKLRRRNPKL